MNRFIDRLTADRLRGLSQRDLGLAGIAGGAARNEQAARQAPRRVDRRQVGEPNRLLSRAAGDFPTDSGRNQAPIPPLVPVDRQPTSQEATGKAKAEIKIGLADAQSFLAKLETVDTKVNNFSLANKPANTKREQKFRTSYLAEREQLFIQQAAALGHIELDPKTLTAKAEAYGEPGAKKVKLAAVLPYSRKEAKQKAKELKTKFQEFAKYLVVADVPDANVANLTHAQIERNVERQMQDRLNLSLEEAPHLHIGNDEMAALMKQEEELLGNSYTPAESPKGKKTAEELKRYVKQVAIDTLGVNPWATEDTVKRGAQVLALVGGIASVFFGGRLLAGAISHLAETPAGQVTPGLTPGTTPEATATEKPKTFVTAGEAVDGTDAQFQLGKQAWMNPTSENHLDVSPTAQQNADLRPGNVIMFGNLAVVSGILTGVEQVNTADGQMEELGIGFIDPNTNTRSWIAVLVPPFAYGGHSSINIRKGNNGAQPMGDPLYWFQQNAKLAESITLQVETKYIDPATLPASIQDRATLLNKHLKADDELTQDLQSNTTPPNNNVAIQSDPKNDFSNFVISASIEVVDATA